MSRRRNIRVFAVILAMLSTISCSLPTPNDPGDAAHGASAPGQQGPECELSAADRRWIDHSVAAWHFTSGTITGVGPVSELRAVFFDDRCVLASDDAMTGKHASRPTWSAESHDGDVPLGNGQSIPAAVTSFTTVENQQAFFVMSTPSIWRAGGVTSGEIELETLMTAVVMHEATHVVQLPSYGRQITELSVRHGLPDSFNDDSVQELFEGNTAFASSVMRETDLLIAAANAGDMTEARRLAAEALTLLRSRQNRWFTGELAYLTRAEELWLSLEGAGQWAGYSWLVNEKGANLHHDLAMSEFGMRSKWWSQNLGLALVLAIDRLNVDWKRQVFGNGKLSVVEILEQAASS